MDTTDKINEGKISLHWFWQLQLIRSFCTESSWSLRKAFDKSLQWKQKSPVIKKEHLHPHPAILLSPFGFSSTKLPPSHIQRDVVTEFREIYKMFKILLVFSACVSFTLMSYTLMGFLVYLAKWFYNTFYWNYHSMRLFLHHILNLNLF